MIMAILIVKKYESMACLLLPFGNLLENEEVCTNEKNRIEYASVENEFMADQAFVHQLRNA